MKYSSLDICEFAYVKGLEHFFLSSIFSHGERKDEKWMLFNVIYPMSVFVWANAELDYKVRGVREKNLHIFKLKIKPYKIYKFVIEFCQLFVVRDHARFNWIRTFDVR